MHVRLTYTLDGEKHSKDFDYIAAKRPAPTLVTPEPGFNLAWGALSGHAVTFEWDNNGHKVTRWELALGTTEGATDIFKPKKFKGKIN